MYRSLSYNVTNNQGVLSNHMVRRMEDVNLGTPYLLSLGLSKAQMSLVWLAGPLSGISWGDTLTVGLITQPLVGAISDRSRLRWGIPLQVEFNTGRRRPFMVAGSALVGINLMIIGWTKEIASLFLADDSPHYQTLVIWIAVISVYLLDFAINAGTSLH